VSGAEIITSVTRRFMPENRAFEKAARRGNILAACTGKLRDRMDRDVAIRLDGMLIGALGYLDSIAHYMKNNLSEDEYKIHIKAIGKAMGETTGISSALHARFPDIVPKELRPPSK
jgi:hypothetical protein